MLQNKPGQMQRDPSDMDGSRARPASPGSADNAPSPSKRQRLDGGAFNPNQGGMVMQNGRPAQGMPGQQQVGNGPNSSAQQLLLQSGINPASLNPDQLQVFANQNPAVQAKTIATYAANLQQHHGSQMPNKPMPNSAPIPQGQGSPMVPQGPDGANLGAFYNAGEMAPGNMRPGPNNGQAAGGNNHALQDYQMQLMLLEQQNKKRLMMARQEQDMSTMPRDGPGGPGGPAGAPQGPNGGQAFQGTSPPGGRPGASPNPADQMKRVNQQMANPANMGSPLPADAGAAARNSPSNAMSFMGNLEPSQAQFLNMVNTGQINGGMRPPGPHPGQPFNGQMNPQQQQQMMGRGQQAPGGPNLQWQAGPNPQIPPGGAQPGVQGTPQPRSMPPPSAPAAAAAANNANSRNTTSSPQVSTAAPPTPQQSNKAAPKKKDSKAKAKVRYTSSHPPPGCALLTNGKTLNQAATQKKSNSNLNSGATPAADAAPEQEPTPATPITPVNPASFGKGQNAGAVVVNGQATAPAAPAAAAVVPPHADSAPNGFTMDSATGLVRHSAAFFLHNYLHRCIHICLFLYSWINMATLGFRWHGLCEPSHLQRCPQRLRLRLVPARRCRCRRWLLRFCKQRIRHGGRRDWGRIGIPHAPSLTR